MRLARSTLRLAAILLLVGVAASGQEPSATPPEGVVEMDALQVSGRSLKIGWHARVSANTKTDRISRYIFTQIDRGSLAEKAGIKSGDRLLAIDGHPVIGITVAEYLQLVKRTLSPGETATFALSLERGIFRRELVVKLQVTL